jgi:two-component sensor histidine kinase
MAEGHAGYHKPRTTEGRHDGTRTLYFIATAVLAAVIPLILFGGFWIRLELNKNHRDLEALLTSRAAELSQRIDAILAQQLYAIQVVTSLPSLDRDLPDFYLSATRIASAMPQWIVIGVIDPATGRQILNTSQPFGTELTALPPKEAVGRVVSSRAPLIHSSEEGGSPIYGKRSILLYVPTVQDASVRHIVVVAMAPEGVQRLVNERASDGKLLTVVLDDGERILARSRAPERYLGVKAGPDFLAMTSGRNGGLFESQTLDGQPVATAFSRSELTGWVAIASMDRKEFETAARRSLWATLVAAVLSIILAGILAVFLFHNVMERRISNERLAASTALGELDARLLATTQDALEEQRKAASEREVLLREIYHRVKNNLQIVQSLLRLGSRDLTREQREPFETAVRRIGAMARVHTLLYNSPDLASIDFKDYLDELVREAADAFGAEERGIRTKLVSGSMRLPLDTAVPLAFVAVELLTNVYRHAFPPGKGGEIVVEAHTDDERHGVLMISDNGVGVPSGSRPKRPLGLTIVAKLVQQIGGTFEEPQPGASTFRIRFPLHAPPDKEPASPGS